MRSSNPDHDRDLVHHAFVPDVDRYTFDFDRCHPARGWMQWDTTSDAHDFGVWVHLERMELVTFQHGELTEVRCLSPREFAVQLETLEEYFGPPPPIRITRHETGSVEMTFGSRVPRDYISALRA
jgi:hypothetical protein